MSTDFSHLPAPAKLNLFLHITGRRFDGYHLLESVFVLIDLCDFIDIDIRHDGQIVRTGDIVGNPDNDLCLRAARLLQPLAAPDAGCSICLKKNIPSGAGMGGGSSDAATTLIALNRLWDLNLSRQELIRIGVKLGADVPFFIFGQSAFARGIGEQLEPIGIPVSYWAIVMPRTPTPTARVFSDPLLTRNTKSITMANLSDEISRCWPKLPGRNDMQSSAMRINNEVCDALQCLGADSRMTGSGSACFVYASTKESALQILQQIPEYFQKYVAETLPLHPLYGWI